MKSDCDYLFRNFNLMQPDCSVKSGQSLVVAGDRIVWVGEDADLPAHYVENARQVEISQDGRDLLTPGLIDCHTHLIYAGNRANEFEMRMQGLSYAEIARQGGGILSTVRQTREASFTDLVEGDSKIRLADMLRQGVTTVEIKSGYGLDLENELKMLQVAGQLQEDLGLRVEKTFLGAHAIPPEYRGRSQAYVDYLCQVMLPQVAEAGLASAVDVFCETIAFSLAETEQIFQAASALGLQVKCHAEQLSNMGAASLAARYQALSCDHLEFLDEAGAEAMAEAGVVAVLLPGAYYFLRERQTPPIELLRSRGVAIAIATDCNPGSSPTTSLPLMMSMACQFFGLTVKESLAAVTLNAARALGVEADRGSLEVGKSADLLLWKSFELANLCYYFAYGHSHQPEVMVKGRWLIKS